jgi:hypothetical protein
MKDDRLFYMFVSCMAWMVLFLLHIAQQKQINNLQTQIDELTIIVNERFLPALMLDKEVFHVR